MSYDYKGLIADYRNSNGILVRKIIYMLVKSQIIKYTKNESCSKLTHTKLN
jgi:hypothetical protein